MVDRLIVRGHQVINEDDVHRPVDIDMGLALPSTPGANLGSTVTFKETRGILKQTELVLASHVLTVVDSGANGGHASRTLFTCPIGNILVLGAYAELTITEAEAGIGDTAAVVAAIGTTATATDNATLTGTEADIVASTAMTLVSSTDTEDLVSTGTECPATFDGTSTAIAPKLNFAIPATDISANGDLTIDGTILLTWMLLGPIGATGA